MTVRTFDPKELVVNIGGSIIDGFADVMISITPLAPNFRLIMGIDGEATRAKNTNRSARIVLTLQQSSLSNEVLSLIAIGDLVSNVGLFPFLMKDFTGTTIATAATAFVEQIPAITYSKNAEVRTWNIITDSLVYFVGSNTNDPDLGNNLFTPPRLSF